MAKIRKLGDFSLPTIATVSFILLALIFWGISRIFPEVNSQRTALDGMFNSMFGATVFGLILIGKALVNIHNWVIVRKN